MSDAIYVDPTAVRRAAAELDNTAYRIAHALQATPDLTVAASAWAAAQALATLEDAVAGWLGQVADRTATASRLLRAAMDGYEHVDATSARRTPEPPPAWPRHAPPPPLAADPRW